MSNACFKVLVLGEARPVVEAIISSFGAQAPQIKDSSVYVLDESLILMTSPGKSKFQLDQAKHNLETFVPAFKSYSSIGNSKISEEDGSKILQYLKEQINKNEIKDGKLDIENIKSQEGFETFIRICLNSANLPKKSRPKDPMMEALLKGKPYIANPANLPAGIGNMMTELQKFLMPLTGQTDSKEAPKEEPKPSFDLVLYNTDKPQLDELSTEDIASLDLKDTDALLELLIKHIPEAIHEDFYQWLLSKQNKNQEINLRYFDF